MYFVRLGWILTLTMIGFVLMHSIFTMFIYCCLILWLTIHNNRIIILNYTQLTNRYLVLLMELAKIQILIILINYIRYNCVEYITFNQIIFVLSFRRIKLGTYLIILYFVLILDLQKKKSLLPIGLRMIKNKNVIYQLIVMHDNSMILILFNIYFIENFCTKDICCVISHYPSTKRAQITIR